MNNGYRWVAFVGVLVLAAMVGIMAFNAGMARGLEHGGKIVAAPGTPYPYPYYYGWHPWGGGFFIGPLFLGLFFIMSLRAFIWRGGWHRRGGYACGAGGPLDEWHRQAHDRMRNGGEPGAAAKP
jgi:hypothetical protein